MRHVFSAILLAAASTTAFAQGTTTGPILTIDEAVTLDYAARQLARADLNRRSVAA